MISVERICKYSRNSDDTEPEDKKNLDITNWPSEGKIEFEKVIFDYNYQAKTKSQNQDIVFNNLDITFEPGKHVGIIGILLQFLHV